MRQAILVLLSVLFVFSCKQNTDSTSHENLHQVDTAIQQSDATALTTSNYTENSEVVVSTEGIGELQGVWVSFDFDDEFKATKSIDRGLEKDPYPFIYVDFLSQENYLSFYDFTTFLAKLAPNEEIMFGTFEVVTAEKHFVVEVLATEKNKRSVTSVELISKNDYDLDSDGEADDLHTLDIILFSNEKIVTSHKYYRTQLSPDQIANKVMLFGNYEDEQGRGFNFGLGESAILHERYKGCSDHLATQDCWTNQVYKLTTPFGSFNYTLIADEGGNDLIMQGEEHGYTFSWKNNALELFTDKGNFTLVKKNE